MTASLAILAIGLAALSGFSSLFFDKRACTGQRVACALLALAGVIGILAALRTVLGVEPSHPLELPWDVPGGRLAVEVDEISAVFLIQIFLIGVLGAVYGLRYWRQSEHEEDGRKLTLFYGLTVASMALIVVARHGMLFLFGWEGMAISAYFLVTTEDRKPEVREAGFTYLVATRSSSLSVIAMFSLFAYATKSFAFTAPPSTASAAVTTAIFLLGLFGFGIKGGMMPVHVWLPGAHANAPSHVSALMSGVLIKMGIYGLMRLCSLVPNPPLWWGATILALGIVSGVLGVAYALAQHDLKRLLAYHSVENIGIILMGLGLAMMGRTLERPDLVVLGLSGSLLHVLNHGLFKALLFLSAGAVVHATGTRTIDRLGGVLKKMPLTALFFLIGAVAICGLPPLNGFVSELFIYLGLFRAALSNTPDFLWLVGVALAVPALGLIGALAVACFVKVFGAVFLGAPRSAAVEAAHDPKIAMTFPLGVLASACAVIGLAPIAIAPMLQHAASAFAPEINGPLGPLEPLSRAAPLEIMSVAGGVLVILCGALVLIARAVLRRRAQRTGPTWDCGYALPSARMQYTASSFAEMLVKIFSSALRPKAHRPEIDVLFPKAAHFESHVGDVVLDAFILPGTGQLARFFVWFRWLQRGSIPAYLLYILIAVLLLHFVR